MNKFYLIVPVVLLAGFIVIWNGAQKEMEAKEIRKKEQAALAEAEKAAQKKKLDQQAEEDARKRQAEREKADREREEKKRKDYEDAMNTLRREIDMHTTEAAKLEKESLALEKQLSDLRTQKEKLNREAFELTRKVELAKIDRRNAEIEIQRTYEMVAKKFSDSNWANPPPPPPPPPKK
jgi:chromosome segregation ATPase